MQGCLTVATTVTLVGALPLVELDDELALRGQRLMAR